jgi:hypothetical protein
MEDFFRRFFFVPNFAIAFEEQVRLRAAAQHISRGSRLCIHLVPQMQQWKSRFQRKRKSETIKKVKSYGSNSKSN